MADGSELDEDGPSARLRLFEEQLREELGSRATIERSRPDRARMSIVDIRPSNPRSLRMCWLEMVGELGFQAGHQGGRWELDRTEADAILIESLVRAVAEGRVVETFAQSRSRVEIVLEDGSVRRETGYNGILLAPLPGWPRWGRKVKYEPY
jgi:hypothetical protein